MIRAHFTVPAHKEKILKGMPAFAPMLGGGGNLAITYEGGGETIVALTSNQASYLEALGYKTPSDQPD